MTERLAPSGFPARSVLITGGTGFLGQALVRRILANWHDVTRLCVYSRGEVAQHHMRAALDRETPSTGWALLHDRMRYMIGDVRDRDRLRRALEGVDYVVHAAALKRVEVGEYDPSEMVRTNIDGARHLIEAAIDAQVSRVVAISTDKACEPLNTYGVTKAAAERLFLGANHLSGGRTRFSVVRYGNVAGSTGSVIPTWQRAIEGGHGVLLTEPTCTRFWMTVAEAVDMILNVLQLSTGHEIVVPDLPAYQLGDLLAAMHEHYGREGAVFRTGLNPGEKRHESMISANEAPRFVRVGEYWISSGGQLAPSYETSTPGLSSDTAYRLTTAELRSRLGEVLRSLPC